MGEPLIAMSDLKNRFSQFDRIAAITGELQQSLQALNKDNVDAAGKNDTVAHAYHGQVDAPTNGMVDLVNSIATMFGLTGANGSNLVDLLNAAEANAQGTAQSWNVKP
jgi:hypothetical protein